MIVPVISVSFFKKKLKQRSLKIVINVSRRISSFPKDIIEIEIKLFFGIVNA